MSFLLDRLTQAFLEQVSAFFSALVAAIFALFSGGAVLVLGGCLSLCMMSAGCAGKDSTFEERQKHLVSAMDALRQANFEGSFRFHEGGSPLGLNASTNWSLGPQQMTLSVEGDIDFTKPPRAVESKPAGPQ